MTVVAIHQPSYFPWFGVLDKISRCDTFIILDDVQFNKRAYQHRTLYSSSHGPKYLTLPVFAKGHQKKNLQINEITLVDKHIFSKHLETLRHRYHKSPGWNQFKNLFSDTIENAYPKLIDLVMETFFSTLNVFKLAPEIIYSSELQCDGSKDDLMLALTRAVNGDTYLSGQGAKRYMDENKFTKAGIEVLYQNIIHPSYTQSHRSDFQFGCFALEWFIEDPENACSLFTSHIHDNGEIPPRCVA